MKIAVIIGSVREGRITDRLAKWVATEAGRHTDVEIIDLMDYVMPLFDEPGSPRYAPDRKSIPVVQKWLDKIAQFDGYVMVTPEYNRSTSGALKNAIDYLAFEIDKKPVALVGHGSSGGAQAVGHLRGILPGVGAITVPQALFFTHRVGEVINEHGELNNELQDNAFGPQANLNTLIESLLWYANALSAARVKT